MTRHRPPHRRSNATNLAGSAQGFPAKRRSTLLPEVPTIAEAGIAGFDFPIWYGIWVPAGTPNSVVDKLSNDIGRIVAGPELRDWIAKHGGEPMSMTQPQFARFVQSESEGAARLALSSAVGRRKPLSCTLVTDAFQSGSLSNRGCGKPP